MEDNSANRIVPDFTKQDAKTFAQFDKQIITPDLIRDHANQLLRPSSNISHQEITCQLLKKVEKLDFQQLAYPEVLTA
ncbi:hypothetical protein SAMN05444266_107194 [Chitinophaga jiangningensis]|uniref:Uncharacterized protein n=1 Tax=Chitinophaga jiangningensis TaxID=1419482 RepID=A0A1M7HDK8_9BACT|nr:hypothetical protein SAMN05444266_107194 [Chitinophaga jiangningensis]